MADAVLDAVPSDSGGNSILSALNKLPTKRIDAAITRAREESIPEQGEQTGGYTFAYIHIQHIPLFPLYSEKQDKYRAISQKHKEVSMQSMDRVDPDKNLTGTQKAFMSILGHASGASGILSAKRWERRLVGLNVMSANMSIQNIKLIVFSRWTVPNPQGALWFVDVIESRFVDQNSKIAKIAAKIGTNAVHIKVGVLKDTTVTLRLLGQEATGIKGQMTWKKTRNNELCESIELVCDHGGEMVRMEMVARIQRACTSMEAGEMLGRFDKKWVVPTM